jgi:hypothetical protein
MATELDEALTAAGVPALVQKVIDPMLLEYQRRYSPMVRTIPTKKISSTTYYFNRRTLRAPGGFVTDGGARPMGASVYEQFQFTIRLLQSVGGVTGFAQEVTRDQIGDLRAQEVASCMQGLLWDIENALIWGSEGATKNGPWPQYDGLDVLIKDFTGSASTPQNAIDFAGASLSLGALDQLIDAVETNAAMPLFDSQWMFVMSSTAQSRIAQLETPNQRFLDKVEVAAGLIVNAYRNIPMIKSSFLSSRLVNQQMGTVTSATATTGGSLAAATYYYQIEPVLARAGAMKASAEVSQVTTGATSKNTLTFTAPSGIDQSAPISYRVYRGTATGQATLLGIVDAVVTPAAGLKPRASGGEDIYLIPRDPDILVRPYVRDVTPLAIYPTTASPDQLPFALATDTCLALRAPKYAGRLRNVVATLS